MTILFIGLIIFLGSHLVPAMPGLRNTLHDRLGEGAYKGLYSLISLAGFALIIWGYGRARAADPAILWTAPAWAPHLVYLLMLISMILLAAAYVPAGRIKQKLRHPMVLAVKVWALGHLLINGDAASVVLFGSFLAWAIVDRISLARRERAGQLAIAAGPFPIKNDIIAVIVGVIVFAALFFQLHQWLIGVPVY